MGSYLGDGDAVVPAPNKNSKPFAQVIEDNKPKVKVKANTIAKSWIEKPNMFISIPMNILMTKRFEAKLKKQYNILSKIDEAIAIKENMESQDAKI